MHQKTQKGYSNRFLLANIQSGPPYCRMVLSQMTNDGGEAAQTALAECNYQGLKCYQPQSYGLSNNAAGAL